MNKYENYIMTTPKKTTRRKAYKNMSVNELVTARKELVEKMAQIDAILGKAVEAFGAIPANKHSMPTSLLPNAHSNYDPAFGNPSNYQQTQAPLGAQVAMSNEAPVMTRPQSNALNQDSGFTIFDADAHARKQAETEAEQQYLVQTPGVPVAPEYDFNNDQISSEIASLREEISNSKINEGDIQTSD